jgi:hypothetical protein
LLRAVLHGFVSVARAAGFCRPIKDRCKKGGYIVVITRAFLELLPQKKAGQAIGQKKCTGYFVGIGGLYDMLVGDMRFV